MKATELNINNLSGKIYNLVGTDLFWIDKSIKFFASLVDASNIDFNLKIFDKANDEILLNAISTISMFGGNNVIIIKDKDFKTSIEKKIIEYLDRESETYLIFVNCTLTKELKKNSETIECDKQDISVVKNLIKTRLNIDYDAINLLISYTNQDMSKIDKEIEKLIAYSNNENITVNVIKELVVNQIENQIFDLTNAVSQQNRIKTMEILQNFEERGLAYPMLLSTLINQYRKMLHCSISSLNDEDLAILFNVKQFSITKARQSAKNYSKVALKNLLISLEKAEVLFKSGTMSDETAFKNIITQLII